jgi:HPt (histidine-containing phosphotransfer) domain-containing protein
MPEAVQTATQKAIAALWQRNQPQILERLALLDRAAAAARAGALTPALHAEAIAVAHKLAGSLGMFGFHEGTRIARELEQHLESEELNPTTFTALTAQLRQSIL